MAYAVTLAFNPYLPDILSRSSAASAPAAEYETPVWNHLRQQPQVIDTVPLRIRNVGTIPWFAEGRQRVAVSYRWLDIKTRKTLHGHAVTRLPHDVGPGEDVEVMATFETPPNPGDYLMAMELFVREFDWFSNANIPPAYIEAEIREGVQKSVDRVDLSTWYEMRKNRRGFATPAVPRSDLWRAAYQIFKAHPFGIGPDNYRLVYGKYLGFAAWNTDIYSNNLYLELLVGSGILGLITFGLFVVPAATGMTPAALAVCVFLVHGLVDVFLMTTPIYFAFWILCGLAVRSCKVTDLLDVRS